MIVAMFMLFVCLLSTVVGQPPACDQNSTAFADCNHLVEECYTNAQNATDTVQAKCACDQNTTFRSCMKNINCEGILCEKEGSDPFTCGQATCTPTFDNCTENFLVSQGFNSSSTPSEQQQLNATCTCYPDFIDCMEEEECTAFLPLLKAVQAATCGNLNNNATQQNDTECFKPCQDRNDICVDQAMQKGLNQSDANCYCYNELKLCGEARQCPSADLVGLFGNLFCGEDPIVLPMSPITLLCPNATICETQHVQCVDRSVGNDNQSESLCACEQRRATCVKQYCTEQNSDELTLLLQTAADAACNATVGACSDTSLAPCHAYQAQCQDGRAECSCLSQVAQCYATKGCMLSGVVQNACVEAGCGSECNPTGSAVDTTTTMSNGRATPGPSTSSPSSGPSSTATSESDVQPSLTETTETTEATSAVAESSSVARVFVNVVLCGALLLTFV